MQAESAPSETIFLAPKRCTRRPENGALIAEQIKKRVKAVIISVRLHSRDFSRAVTKKLKLMGPQPALITFNRKHVASTQ